MEPSPIKFCLRNSNNKAVDCIEIFILDTTLDTIVGLKDTISAQLQRGLFFILLPECIFICITGQSSPQKRQCAFKNTTANKIFEDGGVVNGSVQVCESTQCCVGYYRIINDQPRVDILGKKL